MSLNKSPTAGEFGRIEVCVECSAPRTRILLGRPFTSLGHCAPKFYDFGSATSVRPMYLIILMIILYIYNNNDDDDIKLEVVK